MDLLGKSRHPGGKEDTGLSGAGRIWNCWGGGGAGALICSCLVFSPSISTLNPSEEEDNADHTPWIPLVTSQAFFLYSVVTFNCILVFLVCAFGPENHILWISLRL